MNRFWRRLFRIIDYLYVNDDVFALAIFSANLFISAFLLGYFLPSLSHMGTLGIAFLFAFGVTAFIFILIDRFVGPWVSNRLRIQQKIEDGLLDEQEKLEELPAAEFGEAQSSLDDCEDRVIQEIVDNYRRKRQS